jgi:hypothetical protein
MMSDILPFMMKPWLDQPIKDDDRLFSCEIVSVSCNGRAGNRCQVFCTYPGQNANPMHFDSLPTRREFLSMVMMFPDYCITVGDEKELP